MLVKSTACRTRHCFTMRGIARQPRHKTKTTRWVDFYFVVFVSGVPRHIKCLRGNRNDLTARCWSNLLLVEPALFHNAWYRPSTPAQNKNHPLGGFLFCGRSDWVRTSDLYVPNVALYQAELHSENYVSSRIMQLFCEKINQIYLLFLFHYVKNFCNTFSGQTGKRLIKRIIICLH